MRPKDATAQVLTAGIEVNVLSFLNLMKGREQEEDTYFGRRIWRGFRGILSAGVVWQNDSFFFFFLLECIGETLR